MTINKNVIICGIVRNVGNLIANNINLALKTGEHFNKYKIIVYENNSTDNTKSELDKFSTDKNVKIISEDILDIDKRENNKIWAYTEVTGSSHPCRIELISNARNKLLQEIRKDEYNEYCHVIVIDFDSHGWEIDGIINSFQRTENWDALFASSHQYYDFYALRSHHLLFGPEVTGQLFWSGFPKVNMTPNKLIPVYSAFNGIGIYKKELLMKFDYHFEINENVKKIYRCIFRNMKEDNTDHNLLKIIASPCEKFPNYIKDDLCDIVWKANSGYDSPVVCEHVCLHFALLLNGYKLFINPQMIYHR
jgi:hypothetical protein